MSEIARLVQAVMNVTGESQEVVERTLHSLTPIERVRMRYDPIVAEELNRLRAADQGGQHEQG